MQDRAGCDRDETSAAVPRRREQPVATTAHSSTNWIATQPSPRGPRLGSLLMTAA